MFKKIINVNAIYSYKKTSQLIVLLTRLASYCVLLPSSLRSYRAFLPTDRPYEVKLARDQSPITDVLLEQLRKQLANLKHGERYHT